jgi:hypothetical protein
VGERSSQGSGLNSGRTNIQCVGLVEVTSAACAHLLSTTCLLTCNTLWITRGIFTLRTSCSIETCEFHRVLVSIRPPLLCLVRQTLFPNYKQPCGKQRLCEQGQVTKTAPHSLRVLPTSDGVTFGFGRREEFKVVTAFIRLVSKEVNLLEVAMLLHVLQAVGLVPTDWKYIKADLQTPT